MEQYPTPDNVACGLLLMALQPAGDLGNPLSYEMIDGQDEILADATDTRHLTESSAAPSQDITRHATCGGHIPGPTW